MFSWRRSRKVVRAIGREALECKSVDEATTYQQTNPSANYNYRHPLAEWDFG